MNAATIQLILALLPVAEKVIFSIAGEMVELSTKGVDREALIKALENSPEWPELKFVSPNPGK